MASPVVIEPTMQKSGFDCVVACLSMLLGVPYHDAVQAATRVDKDVLSVGLTVAEAKRTAKLLGVKMTIGSLDNLDEATGILYVKKRGITQEHAVLMFNGTLYNPADGLLYIPDAYFASKEWKPSKLLII